MSFIVNNNEFEIRVYTISTNDIEDFNNIHIQDFMEIAENNGNVETLDHFIDEVNNVQVHLSNVYMKACLFRKNNITGAFEFAGEI